MGRIRNMFGNHNEWKDFHLRNNKASFYHIESKRDFDKTKIAIISITVLSVFILVVVTIMIVTFTMQKDNEYKEYQAQMQQMQQEEQEKKMQQEAEEQKAKQAKLPNLTQQGMENMQHIYHSDTKRVFLTFDDGPSKNTSTILDYLKQEAIKVTFFELGARVEAKPELVKRAYDEGHYIASHGYSHVYSQIYASTQSVLDEYNQCVQVIRNAIGEPTYDPHLFRFPGGTPGGPYADLKAEAKQLLIENKVLSVDWNALSGDAEGNNRPVEEMMSRLEETVGNKNSVVLLMHDAQTKTTTVEALPHIVAFFRDRGYEFTNFYEIIK